MNEKRGQAIYLSQAPFPHALSHSLKFCYGACCQMSRYTFSEPSGIFLTALM